MDVQTTRRRRLRELVAQYGGQAALSRASGKPAAYFSQMLAKQEKKRRGMGDKFARDLERALKKPHGWMDTPYSEDENLSSYAEGARNPSARYIVHINRIQAGRPREIVDSYEPGAGIARIGVDAEMAEELGPYAFALDIEGESMLPLYQPGDLVIIDPDEPISPGDIVAARVGSEQGATIKKYRDRGMDADGNPVFELIPLNDDYPPEIVNVENPGELIGPVIEHRRRPRRSRAR